MIHAIACHEKFKNGVKYQWIVAWSPEIGHGDPVARKTATEIGHGNRLRDITKTTHHERRCKEERVCDDFWSDGGSFKGDQES